MLQDPPPPVDPKDRILLRPLSTLGKPVASASGVSFLRRTEYISSVAGGAARLGSGQAPRSHLAKKRRQAEERDNPVFIIRNIMKGFDIAYPSDAYAGPDSTEMVRSAEILPDERSAWKFPKHPRKPNVTLLDSYPILPDLDGFPDGDGYSVIKFHSAPTEIKHRYDDRMDVALLSAKPNEEKTALRRVTNPTAADEFDFELFIPQAEAVRGIKRKFNDPSFDEDHEQEVESVARDDKAKVFPYNRVRWYETVKQDPYFDRPFGEYLAVALHDSAKDGMEDRLPQKAAYIYPVAERVSIRSKRIAQDRYHATTQEDIEGSTDILELKIIPPSDQIEQTRQEVREKYDPLH
jgi:RNA polymerase II-associated factor 1